MPQPLTPRSLRGDAMFDLDGMIVELQGAADALKHAEAHVMRRLANANRLRVSSMEALRRAQEIDDANHQAAATIGLAA